MIEGYAEFEFDLPGALLKTLIGAFEKVVSAPLIPTSLQHIPEEQGVYQIFLRDATGTRLVYIGKTDAKSGLHDRLFRHSKKMQQRLNLNPNDVFFKAVRVYVFTAVDLEAQLIANYGGIANVPWNGSGFGSNDPGKERDTTFYKPTHFETQYPIDISRPFDFEVPPSGTAAELLRHLKRELPYLIRSKPSEKVPAERILIWKPLAFL